MLSAYSKVQTLVLMKTRNPLLDTMPVAKTINANQNLSLCIILAPQNSGPPLGHLRQAPPPLPSCRGLLHHLRL